ncbi:ATP-binding cassette domain-containing protein [Salinicola endophyticus]|uniref:ATP-binding cassette domain-containing protein n=1 Tax=Salinicola endophyticus TaxID=1949083 RepID=A0ABY8FMC2_9GAMM|nr:MULTISPECIES: ATP-binding cassette domain-containing protein [Salinicola]WFF41034.1 ATP-binding cassette domain-containing protein [Salinicola endophyticus]
MSQTERQPALLEAQHLEKRYGDQLVLERLSFRVERGEFVTLVGASGCGKTTFLKLLLGTERISRGSLRLDGRPLPDEPGPDRGVVFQKYSVFPHLSVLGNVTMAEELARSPLLGKLYGAARRRARDNAVARLTEVGLAGALEKYPHELSGGMQQRLAIAQALMMKPRILLLDEPFGALDPGIRQDMHGLITRLWREQQLTIFMITHDVKEAFALGTRLWVFDKVRHDPQAPNAYGATITYDLPVGAQQRPPEALVERLDATGRFHPTSQETLT